MLIISVLVVYRQIQFIQKTNPGYSKDNVIRFTTEGKILGSEEPFYGGTEKDTRRCKCNIYIQQYWWGATLVLMAWTGKERALIHLCILKGLVLL